MLFNRTTLIHSTLLLASILLTACGGGGGGAAPTPAPTLKSIAITPASATVAKGGTANLTATGTFSDNSTANITTTVTWTSATPATASVGSNTGIVTGVAVGNTTVTAALKGITSNVVPITVTASALTGIAVTPNAVTIDKGTTTTFTATGTYADSTTGNISASVTWGSSNTNVATVSTSGVATGVNLGTSTITASASGVTSNAATLTVTAPALTAIAVTPASATLAKGLTTSLIATGAYSSGAPVVITSLVTWTSANPSIASVGASTGVVTAKAATGTTTITASLAGVTSNTVSITVTAATLSSIAVTPASISIAKGNSTPFTATGTYSDTTTGDISGTVTWNSSNTAAATFSGFTATGAGVGSSNITASLSGVTSNTAVLTVTPAVIASIAITPSAPSVAVGSTVSLTATATYSDATTADITATATWSSLNTAAANFVSTAGVATGIAAGSSLVTASASSVTSPGVTLTVYPTYSIGGTFAGNAVGVGLVLQNSAGDNLPIPAGATTFAFPTKLPDLAAYDVTVLSRPRSPPQNCVVTSGGAGAVTAADVNSVVITCTTVQFLTDKPRYAYVTNNFDNTVSGYIADEVTGQLRPNGYVYVGANTGPSSVAVDPSGQFVYVANTLGGSVSAYAISTSGALVAVNGSPFQAGSGPGSITIDPPGRYVYVTNVTGQDITAYSLDPLTGLLTKIPCSGGLGGGCSSDTSFNYQIGYAPRSLTVDPTGTYLYVAHSSGVSAYSIGIGGALTATDTDTSGGFQASIAAGANPNSISINPAGTYAYVANGGSSVSAYSIAAGGALTGLAGLTLAGDLRSIAIDPYGLSLYVANFTGNNVSAYDIMGGGALSTSLGTAASSGTGPASVIVDPSGMFAYMVNNTTADISAYTFDATGLPVAAANVRARAGSVSIAMTKGTAAVSYTPKFALVANTSSGDVSGYSITPGTGVLSQVVCVVSCIGSNYSVGGSPKGVAVHPTGQYAYVVAAGVNSLVPFTINPDGTLSNELPVATGNGPSSVAVDPSGRFAYVTNSTDATVTGYTIGNLGVPIAMTDTDFNTAGNQAISAHGTNPSSITVDPTGRFAYVVNSGDGTVSAYLIIASSGALSWAESVSAGTSPSSVTVDPTGKFAYVVNSGGVSPYLINPTTGVLTAGTPVASMLGPKAIAVSPNGKFAYVANNSDNSVSGYAIDPVSGALTSIVTDAVGGTLPTIAAGTGPVSVTIDISGHYLYVANSGGDVSAYVINTSTGALTGSGAATPAGTSPASIATAGTIQ